MGRDSPVTLNMNLEVLLQKKVKLCHCYLVQLAPLKVLLVDFICDRRSRQLLYTLPRSNLLRVNVSNLNLRTTLLWILIFRQLEFGLNALRPLASRFPT